MLQKVSTFSKFLSLIIIASNICALECLSLLENKLIDVDTETVLLQNECTTEQTLNDLKEHNLVLKNYQDDNANNDRLLDLERKLISFDYSMITIGDAHTLLNTDHTPTGGSKIFQAEDLIKILNFHTDEGSDEVNLGTIVYSENISENKELITTMSFINIYNKEKSKIINLEKVISQEEKDISPTSDIPPSNDYDTTTTIF